MLKILSFGGGVQSTALAILIARGEIECDAIVFCDTGFEQSIVFDFLNQHTIKLLDNAKIPFFIAKAEDFNGMLNGESTFANFLLPPFFHGNGKNQNSISRLPAYCSSKWKTDTFKRFLNKKFKEKSYEVMMGFSTDEMHRAARMSSSKKYQYKFPLLDLRMNRGDCVALVERTFNAPPPRSSCYFCPNHTQHEWREVMQSKDREKVIKIDDKIRDSLKDKMQGGIMAYLTVECKPIDQCDFDDKNEVIFSRLCAGNCFI